MKVKDLLENEWEERPHNTDIEEYKSLLKQRQTVIQQQLIVVEQLRRLLEQNLVTTTPNHVSNMFFPGLDAFPDLDDYANILYVVSGKEAERVNHLLGHLNEKWLRLIRLEKELDNKMADMVHNKHITLKGY